MRIVCVCLALLLTTSCLRQEAALTEAEWRAIYGDQKPQTAEELASDRARAGRSKRRTGLPRRDGVARMPISGEGFSLPPEAHCEKAGFGMHRVEEGGYLFSLVFYRRDGKTLVEKALFGEPESRAKGELPDMSLPFGADHAWYYDSIFRKTETVTAEDYAGLCTLFNGPQFRREGRITSDTTMPGFYAVLFVDDEVELVHLDEDADSYSVLARWWNSAAKVANKRPL